jgi:hypothetical protein
MIDWIDTARAGTGGGGAVGVDTLWALNDSTIRYRKNGVFRNTILRGVYDTRRKVDTAYALNDSTLQIKINGTNRNIILPGRHWNLQGVLNNGSTLTENENIVLADSLEFTSGWVIIDSMRLRSLPAKVDTTANKPVAIDVNGNVVKMAGWPGTPFTLSNVGTGFRLVTTPNGSIKTIIPGYGTNIDSSANELTIYADTSELVTPSDLNDAGSVKLNAPNKTKATVIRGDGTLEFVSRAKIVAGQTVTTISDSYGVGTGASDFDHSVFPIYASNTGTTIDNHSAGGAGVVEAFNLAITNLPDSQNTGPVVTLFGFNTATRGGNNPRNLEMVYSGYRAFLANAFLKHAVPADDASVTATGTWSNTTGVGFFPLKATQIGGNGKVSSTIGDKLTWSFSGTNLVIGFINADAAARGSNLGTFDVVVDGEVKGTFTGNDKTFAVSDPFWSNIYSNNAIILQGLGVGSHTVEVELNQNLAVYIDYFGTLQPPSEVGNVIVAGIPYASDAAYATFPATPTDAVMDQISDKIIDAIYDFAGYPISYVNPNDYYTDAGISTIDGYHPNDTGHAQIAHAFLSVTLTGAEESTVSGLSSVLAVSDGTGNDAGINFQTTGTNRNVKLYNANSGADNFGLLNVYPSEGTNVSAAIAAIPKGTGFSSTIKAQLSIFNTDFVADGTNYETLVIQAQGAGGYAFNSFASGTGTVRDLSFQTNSTDRLKIKAAGNVLIGTSTDNGEKLQVNGSGYFGGNVTMNGLILPDQSAVGTSTYIYNNTGITGFARNFIYPQSGTNVGCSINLVPRGTGYDATTKVAASFYNTDYIADPSNFEMLQLIAAGSSGYIWNSLKNGTGTTRPIKFQMDGSDAITINTDLTVSSAGDISVPDEAYDATGWNGNLEVPTKNAIRDKIESMSSGGITSINGETGPAYTIQGGTGILVTPTTNTATIEVNTASTALPHTLDALYTTAGNSGTSETDLYSFSVPANKIGIDGRTVNFEIDGEFNDNTATAQLKLYFGGNLTLNTGAVNISTANTAWRLKGYIMRTSSTTAHVTYELDCLGLATQKFLGYSNLTSLDFTVGNIFKVTAQAGGAGGGNDDITAHSWQLLYKPQPQ